MRHSEHPGGEPAMDKSLEQLERLRLGWVHWTCCFRSFKLFNLWRCWIDRIIDSHSYCCSKSTLKTKGRKTWLGRSLASWITIPRRCGFLACSIERFCWFRLGFDICWFVQFVCLLMFALIRSSSGKTSWSSLQPLQKLFEFVFNEC